MKRDIKFRIWDAKGRCLLYPTAVALYEKSGNFKCYFPDCIGVYSDDDDLMLNTGLKDKTGKDIWEGDIVEIINDRGSVRNEVVEYNRGGYLVGRFIMGGDNIFKVVGNKYENPKMVKMK